jgi:hypothetical protein
MNAKLLELAKANPQVVANILSTVADAAKANPTVMSGLLGLAAGEITLGAFAKDNAGLFAQLLGALVAHPEVLAALLGAMGH